MSREPLEAEQERTVLRADARRNRTLILEAAAEMFAEEGLGVRTGEIARRAGVGAGTLFRHFPTKQALVDELAANQLAVIAGRAAATLADPDTGRAFERFLLHFVGQHAHYRAVSRVLTARGAAPEEVRAAIGALEGTLGEVIARSQSARVLRADLTVGDVLVAMSACAHLAEQAEDQEGSDPALLRRFVVIVLDGFRAGAGPSPLPRPAPVSGRARRAAAAGP